MYDKLSQWYDARTPNEKLAVNAAAFVVGYIGGTLLRAAVRRAFRR